MIKNIEATIVRHIFYLRGLVQMERMRVSKTLDDGSYPSTPVLW